MISFLSATSGGKSVQEACATTCINDDWSVSHSKQYVNDNPKLWNAVAIEKRETPHFDCRNSDLIPINANRSPRNIRTRQRS
jgi:hypothetical protein